MWQRRWNIIVVRWRCLLTWTEAHHLAGLASELALHSAGTRTYLCAGTRTRSPRLREAAVSSGAGMTPSRLH